MKVQEFYYKTYLLRTDTKPDCIVNNWKHFLNSKSIV